MRRGGNEASGLPYWQIPGTSYSHFPPFVRSSFFHQFSSAPARKPSFGEPIANRPKSAIARCPFDSSPEFSRFLLAESHSEKMDETEFRKRGKEMVDYIADYMSRIDSRRVTPAIEPGYLRSLIPHRPPEKAEPWEQIMDDVEKKILIGVWTHLRFSPNFRFYRFIFILKVNRIKLNE